MRSGDTGRQCGLLEGHEKLGKPHGDARGPFARLAVPGQTRFVERERLEMLTGLRPGAGSEQDHGFGKQSRSDRRARNGGGAAPSSAASPPAESTQQS